MDYDIALLRLQSELIFGSKVHGIKLSRRRIKKGRRCSMLGWETCAFHESVPYSTLRKIRLKTISNRRCLKYFRKTFDIKNNVSKRQLCAIPKCTNKKVTFCRADNGSPLVYRKRQVGILSHPSDELCTKTPSIFTRISPYFKWINRKIYKADKYEKITAYKHTNPTPDDFDENYTIDDVVKHPKYRKDDLENDIVLVKINSIFYFNGAIQAITLSSEEIGLKDCLALGWSGDNETGVFRPRFVHVSTMADKYCKDIYKETNVVVTISNFCAWYKYRGLDLSENDSGNPLIYQDRQMGIISIVGKYRKPVIFTKVSLYINWVNHTTNTAKIIKIDDKKPTHP
nr:glandular kallikrein-like [Onthophagus taurus]